MPMGVKRSPEEMDVIKNKIIETMRSVAGATFYASCQVACVGVSEAYEWRSEDKSFDEVVKKALHETTELALDLAESKLIKKIHEEETRSIFYYLDRKGRKRGYTPVQALETSSSPPITEEELDALSPAEQAVEMERLNRP